LKYQIEASISFDQAENRDELLQYLQGMSAFSEIDDELYIVNDLDGTYKISHKSSFGSKSVRDEVYTHLNDKAKQTCTDKPGYIQKQDVRNDKGEVFGETTVDVVVKKWGGRDEI